MQQLIRIVLNELRSAWRFRWWGAALAWVGFLGGLWWTAQQPNVYEANARVYIDTSSFLRPLLNNQIVPSDIGTQLRYVRQSLFGQEKLERVASAANLDASAVGLEQRQAVIESLRSRIQLRSSGGGRNNADNIYDIGYRHTNRDTAVTVVSTLLNELVEETLGANREGTDTAQRFLDERIKEYESRLQEAEQRLADFKRRNADRLPGTQGGYFEQISQQREALEQAQKDLRLARSRRERLREQLQSESPVMPSGVGGDAEPPPNSIDARIRDYQRELDQLLLQYTEKHPDVIATRRTLERLEQRRGEQLRALGVTNPDQELSNLDTNPVYQSIEIALNEVDVEIASLEADVAEREQELEELRALVDEVPEVEAELKRLNRDYNVIYEQYQSLVQSRETQQLSQKASDTDQVEFRVLDPPMSDFDPVAPDRMRLLAMSFIGALMAGGGVCWLFAQLRPVFSNTVTLREISGLPVLGAVTQAWQVRHRVRRRMALLTFLGIMAGLLGVFGMAAAVEMVGPGLHELASRV